MKHLLRTGAIALFTVGAGLLPLAACTAVAGLDPGDRGEEAAAYATDDLGTSAEALSACGVANAPCCSGNCCNDGSACVYRVFDFNVCRNPPAGGSQILGCNGCNITDAVGCGAALAACGAACATGAGVPACVSCFAGLGASSCIRCV